MSKQFEGTKMFSRQIYYIEGQALLVSLPSLNWVPVKEHSYCRGIVDDTYKEIR